ncbi:YggS family pyridoxal phosphate-dependent enzyme [Pradoshia sp.]
MDVASNLHNIEKRISEAAERAGRNPNEIKIIAVTKYVTAERAKEAVEAGIHHLGENRSEGILAKRESFNEQPVWHFIGSLQTRKVKSIIDKVNVIHSLDRISLAEEIQKRAEKPVDCLVQVNVSGEDTKHGIPPQETMEFVKQLANFDKIKIIGLMTMAPLTDNKDEIRQCFKNLKELQVQIQKLLLPSAPCRELSMGMSNDFEIAVEEGSTMVRIGTALVGNE